MKDVLNPQQRSYCMSQIKGKNTKPEVLLRKAIWKIGLRFRLNYKLYGKPDITFPGKKTVIFIDGCFWHGCPKHHIRPKTNKKFWKEKIGKNIKRDKEVNKYLKKKGWHVLRFWEHQIDKDIHACVKRISDFIGSQK